MSSPHIAEDGQLVEGIRRKGFTLQAARRAIWMSLELSVGIPLQEGFSGALPQWGCRVMEGRATRAGAAARSNVEVKRPPPQPNTRRTFSGGCFSAESFLVLLCLTASLLILPLVLPPLPPPPFLLLLVPVGILAVLLALALMPSDVRNIPSPYL